MNREREIEARVNAANLGKLVVVKKPRRTICDFEIIEEAGDDTGGICTCYAMEAASFIAAAPADIRYLLARVRELEADNAALQGALDDLAESNYKMTHSFKSDQVDKLKAALAPFAAVGAAVAALRDVRPQSSYAPGHAALTIGGATVTFAHLIAAADVLAVRAEAVTGGSVGTGISEIMKGDEE